MTIFYVTWTHQIPTYVRKLISIHQQERLLLRKKRFSKTGDINTTERSRLLESNVRQLILMALLPKEMWDLFLLYQISPYTILLIWYQKSSIFLQRCIECIDVPTLLQFTKNQIPFNLGNKMREGATRLSIRCFFNN